MNRSNARLFIFGHLIALGLGAALFGQALGAPAPAQRFQGNVVIAGNATIGGGLDVAGAVEVVGALKLGSAAAADSKALLDIESTTKGALLPRMTTTQRDAISSPPTGLTIFNTSTSKYNVYDGSTWAVVGSAGAGGLFAGGQNLLTNSSWEEGTTNWTSSAGTYTRVTASGSIVPPGVGAASWDPSAGAQKLTSDSTTVTAADGLSGANGAASCTFKASASNASFTISAWSANGAVSPVQSIVVNTAGFTRTSTNFVIPTSGTIALSIASVGAGDQGALLVDDCFLGKAENFNLSQVSQATFWGGVTQPGKTGCSWAIAQTAYTADYSADTDCDTFTALGNATAPSTKVPGIELNNLPPGEYLIHVLAGEAETSSSQVGFAIYDGSTNICQQVVTINSSREVPLTMACRLVTTSTSNHSLRIRGAAGAGNAILSNQRTAPPSAFQILVYRYPTNSETAYRADVQPGYWSGYHDSTCTLSRTNTAYGAFTADASCGFTEVKNRNFGTVASTGSKTGGLTFTPASTGRYLVIAAAKVACATNSSDCAFQLVDGSGTALGPENIARQNATGRTYWESTLVGIYDATSLATATVEIYGKAASGAVEIDGNAYSHAIDWTIIALDRSMPAPVLVGSVTSNSTGSERIERATYTSVSSTSITSQSGNWLSVTSDNGSGDTTFAIAAGTFSGAPTCVCTTESTNASFDNGQCKISATTARSSTVVRVVTGNTAGAPSDLVTHLMCMGPR